MTVDCAGRPPVTSYWRLRMAWALPEAVVVRRCVPASPARVRTQAARSSNLLLTKITGRTMAAASAATHTMSVA